MNVRDVNKDYGIGHLAQKNYLWWYKAVDIYY